MALQFLSLNCSFLECAKGLFTWGGSCRIAPPILYFIRLVYRTKEELTTKQWHHIAGAPENIVVHFLSRRINTGFWECIVPVCSTHHSLPLDYEVINEAVNHNSAVHLQEPRLHHPIVRKSGKLPGEKKENYCESKCHQTKVGDLDPCSWVPLCSSEKADFAQIPFNKKRG